MMVQPRKYNNSRKDWYFQFDDDGKRSNRYVVSITKTWIAQLNTCDPTFYKEKNEN